MSMCTTGSEGISGEMASNTLRSSIAIADIASSKYPDLLPIPAERVMRDLVMGACALLERRELAIQARDPFKFECGIIDEQTARLKGKKHPRRIARNLFCNHARSIEHILEVDLDRIGLDHPRPLPRRSQLHDEGFRGACDASERGPPT